MTPLERADKLREFVGLWMGTEQMIDDCLPSGSLILTPDEAERVRHGLSEAREGLMEAYDYACRWPIGLDTDPQEQRGMDRDIQIHNMEFFQDEVGKALALLAGKGQT